MIKRIAATSLAFILILSVFTACESPATEPVDTEYNNPPVVTQTGTEPTPPAAPSSGHEDYPSSPPTGPPSAITYKPPIEIPENVRVIADMISGAMRSRDFETVWGLSSDESLMTFIGEVKIFSESDPGDIFFKYNDVLFKFISPGEPDLYRHFSSEFISVDDSGDGAFIRFTLNVYHDYEYPTYEVFLLSGYALTGDYEMFSYPGASFNDQYMVVRRGQVVDGKFEGTVVTEIHLNHGGLTVTEEEWVNGANRANPAGAFPSDGLIGYIRFIANLPNW